MSVLPLHCVKRPSRQPISRRRRMPDVRNMSAHDRRLFSISSFTVVSICAISACTSADVASPSAWYLVRMAKASSRRSLEMSQRGDSGLTGSLGRTRHVRRFREKGKDGNYPAPPLEEVCECPSAQTYITKTRPAWSSDGAACSNDGMRQDQSDCSDVVPYVMPAATMAPTKYDELNSDVRMGRSLG